MDSEYILTDDGELIHWGIKGMKWGQRRYQNKDGSLTPAGKKRYDKETEELKAREKVIKNKERVRAKLDKLDAKKAELNARDKALRDADEASNPKKGKNTKQAEPGTEKKKTISEMSDDELTKAINRARLEEQYRQYMPDKSPKKNKLLSALEPVLLDAGKNAAKLALEKMTKSLLGDKSDGTPPLKTWDDYTKREQYIKAKRENDAAKKKKKDDD